MNNITYPKNLRVRDRELPTGVYYRESTGRYEAKVWEKQTMKVFVVGTFDTVEEAVYQREVYMKGHHWEGVEHDPSNAWGFIYRITCKKTGKQYIGKKQYRLWDGPSGGYKCTDPQNEWFDESLWKANDWKFYTGSQNDLNREIAFGNVWDFKYEVVELAVDKLDLHMAEVNLQIKEDVLDKLDDNGEYKYYNKNIASMEFRAPFLKADMLAKKNATFEEVRDYYLKPTLCRVCGKIVPYKGVCKCTSS